MNFQIVLILLAALATLAAIVLGCAFILSTPESSANGEIVGYTFAAAETAEHTFPSNFRNVETMPRTLRRSLPNRHIYEIKLDGRDQLVRYAAPAVEGLTNLEIGQRVRVTYVERGVPLIWRKIYVTSIEPINAH